MNTQQTAKTSVVLHLLWEMMLQQYPAGRRSRGRVGTIHTSAFTNTMGPFFKDQQTFGLKGEGGDFRQGKSNDSYPKSCNEELTKA